SAVVLDSVSGLAQGFERFEAPLADPQNGGIGVESWAAEEVLRRVERWLDQRDRSRPFFLWAHFFDPHQPYLAAAELLRRTRNDPYLAEVARMDRALGRLTARLKDEGLLERTFLLVAGDHGEALGDHGESTHGAACFDPTLKVPLLLRYPGGWGAGERSGEIVSVADICPTLLEAMGLTPPADLDGLSLYHRSVPPRRGVYFESYYGFLNFGWSPLAGWVDHDGKYLLSSRPQFFDLNRDPGETTDLLAEKEAVVRRDRQAIEALRARPSLALEADPPPGEEALEAIRSLGYAASGDPQAVAALPLEAPGRPSPTQGLEELRRILQAVQMEKNGKRGPAIELLQQVVAANPANGYAQELLGRFLFFSKD
ncbi:MAG: sulfatase-like hydrolase/transferase, partial [Planctomycetota bacterium]